MINDYQEELLLTKNLNTTEYDWVVQQLEGLRIAFDNPPDYDALRTDAQVGYLAGAMDLERPDRLDALAILTGLELFWTPGPEDAGRNFTNPESYPGPSSKDLRLTRWMFKILIDYYLNGDGLTFNETLGYTSAAVKRAEKRAQRAALRSAKANTRADKSNTSIGI